MGLWQRSERREGTDYFADAGGGEGGCDFPNGVVGGVEGRERRGAEGERGYEPEVRACTSDGVEELGVRGGGGSHKVTGGGDETGREYSVGGVT